MQTKLTLKLSGDVIADIKAYAAEQGQSVSKLAENFFRSLVRSKSKALSSHKATPLVAELSGIFKTRKNIDAREEYTKYLIKKYK